MILSLHHRVPLNLSRLLLRTVPPGLFPAPVRCSYRRFQTASSPHHQVSEKSLHSPHPVFPCSTPESTVHLSLLLHTVVLSVRFRVTAVSWESPALPPVHSSEAALPPPVQNLRSLPLPVSIVSLLISSLLCMFPCFFSIVFYFDDFPVYNMEDAICISRKMIIMGYHDQCFLLLSDHLLHQRHDFP